MRVVLADCRRDRFRVDRAISRVLECMKRQTKESTRPTLLVLENMTFVAKDNFSTSLLDVCCHANKVSHRPGRDEQPRFFTAHVSCQLFQLSDCWIFSVHIVTAPSIHHSKRHLRVWKCHCIGSKISRCSTIEPIFDSISRELDANIGYMSCYSCYCSHKCEIGSISVCFC